MKGSILGVAASLALTACATTAKREEEPMHDLEYQLGAEDVVEIAVYQAPEISRTVPVRPDGKISLPLVGDIQASGKTTSQLADELRSRLEGYVQGPRVTVIVQEVHAPRVFVLGEVVRPGAYPLRGRLDLLQAIALAGGLGDFASRGRILLIRRSDGEEERRVIDYDDLVSTRSGRPPALRAGDTIYVP
jgi:polysaccharide export outer membrane protein